MSHRHETSTGAHAGERRAVWAVLTANAALMAVEAVGGVAFQSLALLADSVHLLTDVSGLAIAAVAFRLVDRPPTQRHTFGLSRAEVLAAQANAVILLAAAGLIFFEAVRRLAHPRPVSGLGVLVVASGGLVVNVASAWVLGRVRGRSLNMRGAFLHLASDALGSVGAMVAGSLILIWGLHRADPVISMLIALLVLWASWRLLRDATHVLLEGTPREIDLGQIEEEIVRFPGIDGVHHLHVWSLASDIPALSAHVVLSAGRDVTIHDGQLKAEGLKAMLAERFGLGHVTLEVECHDPDDR